VNLEKKKVIRQRPFWGGGGNLCERIGQKTRPKALLTKKKGSKTNTEKKMPQSATSSDEPYPFKRYYPKGVLLPRAGRILCHLKEEGGRTKKGKLWREKGGPLLVESEPLEKNHCWGKHPCSRIRRKTLRSGKTRAGKKTKRACKEWYARKNA